MGYHFSLDTNAHSVAEISPPSLNVVQFKAIHTLTAV